MNHQTPANNRQETRIRTDIEPGIRVRPHKNEHGQFFAVELYSQAKRGIGSKIDVKWEGTELGLRHKLELAIIELCERQFIQFGDKWDVREMRKLVWEKYRELVSRFAQEFAKLN